jgi:hypothetical protein
MKTTTQRPIPLALTALVAFFSALAALAVTNGHDAHAHGIDHHHAGAPAAAITAKQLALRNEMRVLAAGTPLTMADTLSTGIIKQFPMRFRTGA